MSKKIQNQEEIAVNEVVSKTEKWFEENGKKVIITLVALIILFAGGYAYKYLVMDKNETAAAELIVAAQEHLKGENPNYELALNGNESGAGFLEVIEQYGSTDAGNIAKHYAGICYLRLGDLGNAAKYLEEYDAVGGSVICGIINAQNLGLQGDVAVEKKEYEKAADLFEEAVEESENNYTAPYYLYKQALALVAAGKNAEAKACCQTLIEKYPNSMEKSAAEKLLGL
ncbi:MAG: tetratricopeptide repeat protein [Alistipes sp.]|nr:tetratricopeptide repeat protein [Alistipes sp.]